MRPNSTISHSLKPRGAKPTSAPPPPVYEDKLTIPSPPLMAGPVGRPWTVPRTGNLLDGSVENSRYTVLCASSILGAVSGLSGFGCC